MAKKRKNRGKAPPAPQSRATVLAQTARAKTNTLHTESPAPTKERFHLETLLGAGGMCEVYAALDLRRVEWGDTNPRVAIKRLLPELNDHAQARLALAQEFFTLRHLAHPGVVRVFDLHQEPFGICFSMELLQSSTAQEILSTNTAGMGLAAIGSARKLFTALRFLHSHGVVHGDIKPSNVFIIPEGRIALIDFNVACVTAKPGSACSPVTQGLRESLHLPSYSLLYAGPERLLGGYPSLADDIFAACCTAYEMATGTHPFKRLSALEAQEKSLSPEKPACFSNRQWAVVRKGLSFDPGLRPDAMQLSIAFAEHGLLSQWKQCCKKLLFP